MTANSVVKNLSRDNKRAGINEYKTLYLVFEAKTTFDND